MSKIKGDLPSGMKYEARKKLTMRDSSLEDTCSHPNIKDDQLWSGFTGKRLCIECGAEAIYSMGKLIEMPGWILTSSKARALVATESDPLLMMQLEESIKMVQAAKKVNEKAHEIAPTVFTVEWAYEIEYLDGDSFNTLRTTGCGELGMACMIARTLHDSPRCEEVTLVDMKTGARFQVAGLGFRQLAPTRADRARARATGAGE